MDRLESMSIVVAAADTGSLSGASRRLGIPLATVSRRVSELEEHLNVRLFHRGQRKLVFTDAGSTYAASCRRLLEEVAEAERAAAGEYRAPQGELLISASAVMGRGYVLPIVEQFQRAFPNIRVRLQHTDRIVNLVEEHVDLALRIGELAASSSVTALRVGLIRLTLCASPAYLKRRGVPMKPADLAAHDCVIHEGHPTSHNWLFFAEKTRHTIEVPSRLTVDSGEAAAAAAVAGAGIARVLSHLINDSVKSRSLLKLLEEYEPPPLPVSVVYPSQRHVPLKLRAFLDFAVPRLKKRFGYGQKDAPARE
jgi:DNA-binding transcriptional LysR family regulator